MAGLKRRKNRRKGKKGRFGGLCRSSFNPFAFAFGQGQAEQEADCNVLDCPEPEMKHRILKGLAGAWLGPLPSAPIRSRGLRVERLVCRDLMRGSACVRFALGGLLRTGASAR